MYKICYVIGQLDKAGAEGQLVELVKHIDKEKFQPTVVSLSEGGYWSAELKKSDVNVIEIPRRKNIEFARLVSLFKIIKSLKPDIVHTFMFPANSYGRIAAILAGIKIIIASERSLPKSGKDKNIYKVSIDKLLFLFSHGIICNSYKAAESLINNYSFDSKKIFTVHNGINIANFNKEIRFNSNEKISEKIVATVGSLFSVKNHRLFLDMSKRVLDVIDNKNIKFIIVGKGYLKDTLEEYSKKLGIKDNVLFTGERMDVPDLLHNADIFVITSLYEGISNAIMEAMLAGLPVIATNVGGNSELVIDGETGFLCPSNDAIKIADRVIRLMTRPDEAKSMGKKGKRRILNNFGIERMVSKTEDIYINLIDKYILYK